MKIFSERNKCSQNFPEEIQMFKNLLVSNRLICGNSEIHERQLCHITTGRIPGNLNLRLVEELNGILIFKHLCKS